MRLTKFQISGLAAAFLILVLAVFLYQTKLFFFLIGVAFLVGALPFVLVIVHESKVASEKEAMFLEFSRNLVESVKTGTPISKSIINMRNKPFGVLDENIKKLANQISMGIPLVKALETFARDVKNKTIARALTLIGQSERAGGDIGEILEAVTEAVSVSDRLKKERKAAIQTLVVQGYIIFFVFIVIVLVMQYVIVPMIGNFEGGKSLGVPEIGNLGVGGKLGAVKQGGNIVPGEMANAFLYLLLVQGLFTGLTIGKLSEQNIKAGIKHSFALMVSSFLISTGANILWGA